MEGASNSYCWVIKVQSWKDETQVFKKSHFHSSKNLNLPGLYEEVKNLLAEMNLNENDVKSSSKNIWKKIVKEKVKEKKDG